MATRSHLRGHPIIWDPERGAWLFEDSGEPTTEKWDERPCGHCGRHDTPEGHDGCLGTLPGVMNACCGHGNLREAYVQFPNGGEMRGAAAAEFIAWIKQAMAEGGEK